MSTILMLARQLLTHAESAHHKTQHCQGSVAAEFKHLNIEKQEGHAIPSMNIPYMWQSRE